MRLMVFGAIALLVVAGILSNIHGPVSRSRLERFARRQRLDITVDNGAQVIGYLATTRRWRAAGLAAGFGVSVLRSLPAAVNADFVLLFAGWFLGALVAEVRVAHLAHGPVRTASLQPRRADAYLGRTSWALVPAAGLGAAAVGAGTLVADFAGLARPDWTAAT